MRENEVQIIEPVYCELPLELWYTILGLYMKKPGNEKVINSFLRVCKRFNRAVHLNVESILKECWDIPFLTYYDSWQIYGMREDILCHSILKENGQSMYQCIRCQLEFPYPQVRMKVVNVKQEETTFPVCIQCCKMIEATYKELDKRLNSLEEQERVLLEKIEDLECIDSEEEEEQEREREITTLKIKELTDLKIKELIDLKIKELIDLKVPVCTEMNSIKDKIKELTSTYLFLL